MIIALAIAVFLWVVAQGSSSIERPYDLPIVYRGTPDTLVITNQNADVINIRVSGRRAALRALDPDKLEYDLDLTGAKEGISEFDVDLSALELPRGVKVVSRSPSRVEVELERRWTQTVNVRADLEGKPAEGYRVGAVVVKPARVRITGARSEVRRLTELATETIDVTGLSESVEREVRLSINARTVWLVEDKPVQVSITIEPIPVEPTASEPKAQEEVKGEVKGK